MINIVLNERVYAEEAINNLSLGNRPAETLGRIAKFYYSEGYKKREIGPLLEDFILKCDPSANIVKWQRVIDQQVNSADRYSLIDIPGISITKSEILKIQSLKGKLLQRLMFTMLCLAKYGNAISPTNNSWVNKKDRDIFRLANIAVTTKRQSLMINDLWTAGYVGYSNVVDNINLNVKIVDDDSPEEILITDFRELGYQYSRYCGENFTECESCGRLIKESTNGRRKFCKECAIDTNRQKTIERYYRSFED